MERVRSDWAATDEDRPNVEFAFCEQLLLVVVPAGAGLQRQAIVKLVIERPEDAEGLGVLTLVDDGIRRWIRRAAKVEALNVEVFIEVEDAGLIAQASAVVRRDPQFLGKLVEARDIVLALRGERDEAGEAVVAEAWPAEGAAEASVDVSAAFELAMPIAGHRIDGCRA